MPGRPRKRGSQARARTTYRTVLFLKVHGGVHAEGQLLPYDTRAALQHVEGLSFTTGDRYLEESEDKATCCGVDRLGQVPYHLRLATVRRGDLPRLEQDGQLGPLPIPANSGLAEETYFAFFADGIVGVLFNFYGPRPARLVSYLGAKCPSPLDSVHIEPLLREDVAAQLEGLGGIRLVDLAVRRPALDILRRHDKSLTDGLASNARLGGAQKVRVVLQPEPYSKEGLGPRAVSMVRRLAGIPEVGVIMDRFLVRGYDPTRKETIDIDVLRDQLVSTEEVVFQDRR